MRKFAIYDRRMGFTLIELMVVITIIGMLFVTLMGAMYSAQNMAKRARTQQIIAKMNNQLIPKWEGYQTRRLPIGPPTPAVAGNLAGRVSANQTALVAGGQRLGATRELMRMELPDSYADIDMSMGGQQVLLVMPNNKPFIPRSSLVYQRFIATSPTRLTPPQAEGNYSSLSQSARVTNSNAECLYMVVFLNSEDRDMTALSVSVPETSDSDFDGMKEFADGWGNPILWCRWAGAFPSELQPQYSVPPGDPRYSSAGQLNDPDTSKAGNHLTHDPPLNHDPLDVMSVDRWEPTANGPWTGQPEWGYALYPLIMSGGEDFDPTASNNSVDDGFGVRFPGTDLAAGASAPFDIQNLACPYYKANTSAQRGTIQFQSAYNNIHNQSFQNTR